MKTVKAATNTFQPSNNELQNNMGNKSKASPFTAERGNKTQFGTGTILSKKYSSSISHLIIVDGHSQKNSSSQDNIPIRAWHKLLPQYPCSALLKQGDWSQLFLKDLQYAESRKNYLFDKHIDILPEHRSILLDWLSEICSMYKFHRETYYLTMAYLDRYISLSPRNKVVKKELQLLGLTSLLIATKVEEMKYLPIEDIIYLSDGAYTIKQVLETEKSITSVLDWNCYFTTPNMWLLRFIHSIKRKISNEEYILCTRLVDLATMDLEYLKFPNCVIAASSLKLILSLEVLPETSIFQIDLSIKSMQCTKWLAKYWQEIKRIDNLIEFKKNISNLPIFVCCPNFTNLPLIQVHLSNLETFNDIKVAITKEVAQE